MALPRDKLPALPASTPPRRAVSVRGSVLSCLATSVLVLQEDPRLRAPKADPARDDDAVEFALASGDTLAVVLESACLSAVRRDGARLWLDGPGDEGVAVLPGLRVAVRASCVVYRARPVGGAVELRSVPLDGGEPRVLGAGGVAPGFALSSDGLLAAFRVGPSASTAEAPAVVPVDGRAPPLELAVPFAAGDDVEGELRFATGARLLFAVRDAAGVSLWSAATGGAGEARRLSPAGETVLAWDLADGGARALLLVRGLGGATELRSVLADGEGSPVRLHAVPGGRRVAPGLSLCPAGARVLFAVDGELLLAPVDGSAPARKLVGTPARPGTRGASTQGPCAAFTPDGRRVVFRADLEEDETFELFAVPVEGGPPTKLSGELVPGGDVGFGHDPAAFRVTPDGSRVVFWADAAEDERYELWSAPLDGRAPPARVNGPLVEGGDVGTVRGPAFVLVPGRDEVVYLADERADDVFELFRAPLAGGGPSVRVSGTLVEGGDVGGGAGSPWPPFACTSDGTAVLYLADERVDGRVELCAAPLAGR